VEASAEQATGSKTSTESKGPRIERTPDGVFLAYTAKGKKLPGLPKKFFDGKQSPSLVPILAKLIDPLANQCSSLLNLYATINVLSPHNMEDDTRTVSERFFGEFQNGINQFAKEIERIRAELTKNAKRHEVFTFLIALPEYFQLIKRSVLDPMEESRFKLAIRLVEEILKSLYKTLAVLGRIVVNFFHQENATS
jgi:hypothetical protein